MPVRQPRPSRESAPGDRSRRGALLFDRAPTVSLGDQPGDDIRTDEPVANAAKLFATARRFGKRLPDAVISIGETIPGGTTTAMAVLTALGERSTVSSSLAHNPLALKREVINEALRASGLEAGSTAGEPIETVRRVGDPMLGVVAGLIVGATERGTDVTLAGGTQLAGAAALARHAGVDAPLSLSTTSFVAADGTAAIDGLAHDLELDLLITDPSFEKRDHPAVDGYVAGEAKEGVGMGGALAILDGTDDTTSDLYERITAVYDRLVAADSVSGRSLGS